MTKQWIGGTGNWSSQNSWTPSGVPQGGDTVNVTSGTGVSGTVTYDGPTTGGYGVLNVNLTGVTSGTQSEVFSVITNSITVGQEYVGGYPGSPLHGVGTLSQAGATNTVSTLYLGYNATDKGYYTLSGTGYLATNSPEYVGKSGTGIFTQTGGTNALTSIANQTYAALVVADLAGSTGSYNLSGGSVVVGGTGTLGQGNVFEAIGRYGSGTFTQTGGTNTINSQFGALYLGLYAGASGTYTLGGGILKVIQGYVYVGDAGTGTFVQTGGTNDLTKNSTLDVGHTSAGTYSLSGTGYLATNEGEIIGDGGTGAFVQSGGTNSITGSLGLRIGYSPGSVGSYALSGGTLTNSANENIGYSGAGTFIQTGGAHSLTNGGNMYIGQGSAGGQYSLSGTGTLSVSGGEYVGNGGGATFVQTGGTNTAASLAVIGVKGTPAAPATYTLSGGTATVSGKVNVGGSSPTTLGGKSVLTVSGAGVLNVGGALTVFNTAGTAVNLAGGTISAGALNLNGTPSLLNWTSGTLKLTSGVTFDSAASSTSTGAAFGSALTVGAGQTFAVTGNEGLGGAGVFALVIGGGVHTVTGVLTVNPNGSLAQTGGTLSASTLNGNFTQSGGVASFKQISGGGILTLTGGTTSLSAAGGTSQVAALAITGAGTLDINNDPLVIAYGTNPDPVADVLAYLAAGFDGGAWDGTGVVSAAARNDAGHRAALGYVDADGSVTVKLTVYGDANLDGKIGADDYALIDRQVARGGLGSAATWAAGDFDYNGVVNSADYLLIDRTFGQQAGGLSPEFLAARQAAFGDAYVAELTAAAPEPGGVGIAAIALWGLAARRRRRGNSLR